MNDKIVIAVPGLWSGRQDLVVSIAERSAGYLFAGQVLMNIATSEACHAELYEHDAELARAFKIAGGPRIDAELLSQIADHTFTLYLIGSDLSREGVASMRAFATAILRSGGMAIKIESTGIAHSPERWAEHSDSTAISVLYPLFSTYIGSSEYYYSCGMKNFGRPDCSVSNHVAPETAAKIMHGFNLYQLNESPIFNDGETFSIDERSPRYRLSHRPYGYEPDDPLDNPFGRWHLDVPAA